MINLRPIYPRPPESAVADIPRGYSRCVHCAGWIAGRGAVCDYCGGTVHPGCEEYQPCRTTQPALFDIDHFRQTQADYSVCDSEASVFCYAEIDECAGRWLFSYPPPFPGCYFWCCEAQTGLTWDEYASVYWRLAREQRNSKPSIWQWLWDRREFSLTEVRALARELGPANFQKVRRVQQLGMLCGHSVEISRLLAVTEPTGQGVLL